ncbi:acyl carrier protein [Streptomyces sp. NRRL S-340]|uniref:acyl carrier protein n=1 Tax=Streptomyces sp. NRRL S-340 TaxID=1463901 RepID=UPI0005647DFF|nr:acyl carrier protein [Streptomyces sp. NRRL S-340]
MSQSTEVTAESVHGLLRTELVALGIPEEDTSAETVIDTLEIDSLDLADLLVTVQREYGVNIRRAELAGVTVGGLVDRVLAGADGR